MWLPWPIHVFAGRYFQVISVIQIVSMGIGLLLFDRLNMDPSCVLTWWGGSCLVRRNSIARRWVIGFCIFLLSGVAFMGAYAMLFGASSFSIRIFYEIEHPTLTHVLVPLGIIVCILAVPVFLLQTAQAIAEFNSHENAG
ncbi:hypothetical protein [Adhaeretor mobilis]|uniref:hypothetical protein n=1 Tax=Adhaeretor mobilis TaxID=1930276 RepID=UPI0011A82369|nr:hypothetical protein [Adhaeretor mobilis]